MSRKFFQFFLKFVAKDKNLIRSFLAVKKLKIKIYKEVTGFTAVIKYLCNKVEKASFFLAGILLFIIRPCFSQEAVELGEIVITPYKTAISSDYAGTEVDTLRVGEEYHPGTYSLSSALSGNPSIMAVQSGGLGGDTSIFLRGSASYHTRFLLDGVKLYDPILTQAYYNSAHFYLNGIEKVEISKGPQSSLYGSDAMGGVISLFTKKAEKPHAFSYSQEFGSYNTYSEQLDLESRKDRGGYVFSILRLDSGGFSSTQKKEGNSERDPYKNTNVSLRGDYDINDDLKAGLMGRFIYAKYEYDGTANTSPWQPNDDDDRLGYDYEGIGTMFINHSINDSLKEKFQFAYTRFYRKFRDDTDNINDWYNSKTYQGKWKLEYAPFDFYKLISGFDYVREKGDYFTTTGDFPKQTLNNEGFYIESILTPLKDAFLSFSYRRDEHSSFGGQDSKRVSFSYFIEPIGTKLRGVFGEGFKAPSMYQLYAPSSIWGPIGNSNLAPEHSRTYEVGIEEKLTDSLEAKFTYFRTFFRNLIDFVSGSGYVNVSKARVYGLEAALNYKINDNWDTNISYAWLDTENKENHAQLERRPENKVNFALRGSFNKFNTALNFSYVGHRTQGTAGNILLKPYLLLNASLSYRANENLSLFIRGENILNKDYELVDHYQVKKLSLYFGFKREF